MNTALLKKGTVVTIVYLIIGLIGISNIGGYIYEMDNQFPKAAPINSPLTKDYVLGFWKYDEGKGNIAYDSSGHDFDGTINGATWITGHSGEALKFDGEEDFIGLDGYSKKLGINKTDDLIYSVWFLSESTEDGLIYSMSDKWGISNPELSIQLCSNGSILFKIWTQYCGIWLYSDGTYNDGVWHHLKILFNGITAKPTVAIYVDNKFDGNVTKYLCPIENNEFSMAKTGRRAYNATKHFDGLIDELKIIKYPEGNEQNPPIISGPKNGQPGKEYKYLFETEDPEGDDIWLYIDWGDGQTEDWIGPYEKGEMVTVSHEWSREGRYDIKAKSKDIWHDSYWSQPYTVSIGNQAPDAPEINGPKSGDPGVKYEYTFKATDFDVDDIYYNVDWGDGTSEDWFGPYASGEAASASHVWQIEDNYEIIAIAKDTHEYESNWSYPYVVSIGNQAPSAPEIIGPREGSKGIEYEYNFSIFDFDGDSMYLRVDWGSGTPGKWHGPYISGSKVILNYTWKKTGTFTIKAQSKDVFDKVGAWGTLKVTMPENQQSYNSLIFRFLEKLSSLLKNCYYFKFFNIINNLV